MKGDNKMDKILIPEIPAKLINTLLKNNKNNHHNVLQCIKIEADNKLVVTDDKALFIITLGADYKLVAGTYTVNAVNKAKHFWEFIIELDPDGQFPDYKQVIPELSPLGEYIEVNSISDLSAIIYKIEKKTGVLLALQYAELCQLASLMVQKTVKEHAIRVIDAPDGILSGVILGLDVSLI